MLTFSFEKVTANADGTWANSDGTKPRNAPGDYYAEKSVNPAAYTLYADPKNYDPVKGFAFQAVWNQRLPRTSVTLDPKTGKVASSQRWVVRAYAIYNEAAPLNASVPAPNPNTDKQFRVMGMAHPTSVTAIPLNGDYIEKNRPPGDWFDTNAVTSDGTTTFPVSIFFGPNGGIPHLAVDYAASAGDQINATEYGILDDSADPFVPFYKQVLSVANPSYGLLPQDADDIHAYVLQNVPSTTQWAIIAQTDKNSIPHNEYRLGTNRQVNHGLTNLALNANFLAATDDKTRLALPSANIYDQGLVTSKYCHIATQADNATPAASLTTGTILGADKSAVTISTPIAQVGDWGIFQQKPQLFLARGYFYYENATLLLVNQADVDRTNGGLLPGKKEIHSWPGRTIAFPSILGPHLHFEIRVPQKKNTLSPGGVNLPNGEQNPHQWVILGFGLTK